MHWEQAHDTRLGPKCRAATSLHGQAAPRAAPHALPRVRVFDTPRVPCRAVQVVYTGPQPDSFLDLQRAYWAALGYVPPPPVRAAPLAAQPSAPPVIQAPLCTVKGPFSVHECPAAALEG
jgi:hypothetical protein